MLSRYQPDALRYFLSRERPREPGRGLHVGGLQARTNAELVAGWGNLVNRTASMIAKNVGEIPARVTLAARRPGAR